MINVEQSFNKQGATTSENKDTLKLCCSQSLFQC